MHVLRLNTCLNPPQHRCMLVFSTRCSRGRLTIELECHRLDQYTRARNSSLADQLPHWCRLWQAPSRLLGCMQVTVETHTVDIEATAASGRYRLHFELYLISAAGGVERSDIQRFEYPDKLDTSGIVSGFEPTEGTKCVSKRDGTL